ncbi:response regulator [Candidatus Saccharibacteria bacterium]|nr:response regulator [Candidatus Saccharibacteria bacterium]
MIFIIEDDKIMAECIARACKDYETKTFFNAIEAMADIDRNMPDLIFLDILLSGPDGFTFLNELASYSDTAKIPIIIISSLNLENQDLSEYGVVEILNKDTMYPKEITAYAERFAH